MTTDEDVNQDYIVEFNTTHHKPDMISQNLFKAILERDEAISSIALKLFDLLFEKEFDFKITRVLILDYFKDYQI